MRVIVRFWIAILSLTVSVAAVGYLFLSFLLADTALVFETMNIRIAVTFVALIATGTLIWSTVLADDAESTPNASPRNR